MYTFYLNFLEDTDWLSLPRPHFMIGQTFLRMDLCHVSKTHYTMGNTFNSHPFTLLGRSIIIAFVTFLHCEVWANQSHWWTLIRYLSFWLVPQNLYFVSLSHTLKHTHFHTHTHMQDLYVLYPNLINYLCLLRWSKLRLLF